MILERNYLWVTAMLKVYKHYLATELEKNNSLAKSIMFRNLLVRNTVVRHFSPMPF